MIIHCNLHRLRQFAIALGDHIYQECTNQHTASGASVESRHTLIHRSPTPKRCRGIRLSEKSKASRKSLLSPISVSTNPAECLWQHRMQRNDAIPAHRPQRRLPSSTYRPKLHLPFRQNSLYSQHAPPLLPRLPSPLLPLLPRRHLLHCPLFQNPPEPCIRIRGISSPQHVGISNNSSTQSGNTQKTPRNT